MRYLSTLAFSEQFKQDILSKKKTITIRDENEKNYKVGMVVSVVSSKGNIQFCRAKILSVTPVKYSELNEEHAQKENMSLEQLREVLKGFYPETEQLYAIEFLYMS